MRPWVRSRITSFQLFVVLLVGLVGLGLAEHTKQTIPHPAFDEQIRAARLMEDAIAVLRQEREARGIPIDQELDPNRTGLIGAEFTEITTSLGNLEAKRTSTNPEFAALMVRFFHDLGLQKGDLVAVGASGSFPGLILATLAAADVMDLEPLVIYSIGASMYGANLPEFTFIEMLKVLRSEGLLPYDLLAVSLGGDGDRAAGPMLDGSEEVFGRIAEYSGVPIISEPDNAASIRRRKELYAHAAQRKPLVCFVNIGGASPNYGTTGASLHFPNGLVLSAPSAPDHPEIGLIYEYARAGISVIHLLDIRNLALKNGLAIDPVPFPSLGRGAVFYEIAFNRLVVFLTLASMIFAMVAPRIVRKSSQTTAGDRYLHGVH